MRNYSVAVLDIRSTEICAALAEKGVNHTFIIKNKAQVSYDGFAEGELLDIENFNRAVAEALTSAFSSLYGRVKRLYVSVPAEFTGVKLTDKTVSFNSPQAVSSRHIQLLSELSAPQAEAGKTIISSSALYYVLSDNRNVIDPVGIVSDSLRGRLSFYTAKTSFLECVERAVGRCLSVGEFCWIPEVHSQSMYLIPPSVRDGRAILLDVGNISSSFAVACGNGVEFCESFSVGVGHMALLLMENLQIPYEAAYLILKGVNLNARGGVVSTEECRVNGQYYSFKSSQVRDILFEGLDGFCGIVEECIQAYTVKDMSGRTIFLTGDGVGIIRGLTERLSSRLECPVEVISPKVPYYDKPRFSSLFSLMSAAFGE